MKAVTPKEAIELLESKYHIDGQIDNVLECLAIRHTAVEALKKQVPMKVEEIHVDEYSCPACGAENCCGDIGLIGDNYCPECGQAVYQEN